MPMQSLLLLAERNAFGVCIRCVPMQHLLLLAELKALGVCPCKIYYFTQAGRHWVCAHAEFITFGRTEGIGCVPMQNLLLLTELNTLGARLCGPPSSYPCRVAWTTIVRGRGEGVRGALHRLLHLLRYCATLARPGLRATASCGRWDPALTP